MWDPQYELDLTADERATQFILREARSNRHVHTCEQTTVRYLEGNDGVYGCDTGCEYARLAVVLVCEHHPEGVHFEYGDFGDLNELLERL